MITTGTQLSSRCRITSNKKNRFATLKEVRCFKTKETLDQLLPTHRRNCSYKFFGMNVKMVYSTKLGDSNPWLEKEIIKRLTGCPYFIPDILHLGFTTVIHFHR